MNQTRVGNVLSGWNSMTGVGPIEIMRANGYQVTTTDGLVMDDYIMGWGSCLLGHDSPELAGAIRQVLHEGYLQQYETPLHQTLSELFCSMVPCADRLRLVNSGLEATMYAVRIARAATKRPYIVKFEGHFHGLNDSLTWNIDSSTHRLIQVDEILMAR